jgi:hypothetical protein
VAENEAERLARCAPGAEFFVMESKSRSKKIDVVTTRFDEICNEGELPF